MAQNNFGMGSDRQKPLIDTEGELDLVDDFNFSESDTIGTIIHSEYVQDQQINYRSLKQDLLGNQANKNDFLWDDLSIGKKFSAQKRQPGHHRAPTGMGNQSIHQDKIHVKHLIDISGVRFLYTKQVVELIYHHLIKGFDYKQFRKTDYIDLEQGENLGDTRNLFLDYDNTQAGRRNLKDQNESTQGSRTINFKSLKKEALVALRLEQAQVNFQNNLTESQMLITSPAPVIAVIFAYHKNQAPSLLQNEQIQFLKRLNQRSDLAHKQNEELQIQFENELKSML